MQEFAETAFTSPPCVQGDLRECKLAGVALGVHHRSAIHRCLKMDFPDHGLRECVVKNRPVPCGPFMADGKVRIDRGDKTEPVGLRPQVELQKTARGLMNGRSADAFRRKKQAALPGQVLTGTLSAFAIEPRFTPASCGC